MEELFKVYKYCSTFVFFYKSLTFKGTLSIEQSQIFKSLNFQPTTIATKNLRKNYN